MAEPQPDDLASDDGAHPGLHPTDDELAVTNSWPAGWPRLYPERTIVGSTDGEPGKTSQLVSFVGGSADGLSDLVEEATPGRLPRDLETMGSVYRLVEIAGHDPSYHWHGFEQN